MGATLLDLALEVCDDPGVNLQRPSTLFGDYDEGDVTPRRLVRAMNRCARGIAARYEWQILKREHSFATVAAEVQPSGIPADLLRPVQDTMWVVGLQFMGPVNDADWAAMRAGRLPQAWPSFRIYNDAMHLWPQPGDGQAVTYQYISNAIGTAAPVSEGQPRTPVTKFTADTDKPLWDDEVMILGTVMEYRKAMRKDYGQDQIDFEKLLADRIKADGGSRILSMANLGRVNRRRPVVTITQTQPTWGGSDW